MENVIFLGISYMSYSGMVFAKELKLEVKVESKIHKVLRFNILLYLCISFIQVST